MADFSHMIRSYMILSFITVKPCSHVSWMWCFKFCYFVSYFGTFRHLSRHIVHPVKGKVNMHFHIFCFNLSKLFWFTAFTDCSQIPLVKLEYIKVKNLDLSLSDLKLSMFLRVKVMFICPYITLYVYKTSQVTKNSNISIN